MKKHHGNRLNHDFVFGLKNSFTGKTLIPVLLSCAMLMAGCSSAPEEAGTASDSEETGQIQDFDGFAGGRKGAGGFGGMGGAGTAIDEIDFDQALTESQVDQEFSDRDLDPSYDAAEASQIMLKDNGSTAESSLVRISGNQITITGEGIFEISGSLSDGQIIVDAGEKDKVQLVLCGAEIHCENSAAIYVREADKVFLTLPENSSSRLSGGSSYVDTDENTVDAVVFSK